uniref:GlsB/YeaQ/YmgE family stress response membrane protein n=1 Tax=Paractinoplanes polyasparticus TaxID=2856853 RepID=UPI001C84EBDA|nr:GlsB/YeaQ/YmgE family stress response membrane protein [Actinoplanes polyasparticus]
MTVSGIITALIVGLLVGALGRLVVPGKQNIPVWLTMAIGVVAALLGTILARAAGIDTSGFSLLTLLIQIGLAALGVAVVAGTAGRRRTPGVR